MDRQATAGGGWKEWGPICCRVGVGSLLLVAGLFKFWQVFSGPPPAVHFWESPWLLLLVAQVELVLGVLLLFGIGGLITWAAAVFCFSVFLAAALAMAIMGLQDCGCFGPLKVNPWYTVVLDLTCLAGLLAVRSSWTMGSPVGQRLRYAGAMGAVAASFILLIIGAEMIGTSRRHVSSSAGLIETKGAVFLDAEQWIAKPFPLFPYIQLHSRLALREGRWIAVFYRDNCPKCKDALANLQQALVAPNELHRSPNNVAFIRVPPFDSTAEIENSLKVIDEYVARSEFAQLLEERKWLVQLPLIVELTDGIVTSIQHNSLHNIETL